MSGAEPSEREKLEKKIILGPAVLRRMDEKDHYGMYRPLIVRGWDEELGAVVSLEMSKELGPLKIFRVVRGDERVDIRTVDPQTKREIMLHQTWDARTPSEKEMDLFLDPGKDL